MQASSGVVVSSSRIERETSPRNKKKENNASARSNEALYKKKTNLGYRSNKVVKLDQ
jgi:hypothetical protein